MRHLYVIAMALSLATLSLNVALAQGNKQDDKKPPAKDRPIKSKDKPIHQTQGTKQGDKKPPTDRRNNGQTQNPPTDRRNNGQTQNPPTRPPTDRQPNRTVRDQQNRQPRNGQIVIQTNRNWTANRDHRFHSSSYAGIDIWATVTFGYGGRTYNWNPAAWHYWVEDSLMGIVYRSERMSNALRASFEQQMSGSLRSSNGGQTAWDRVQRMDESLEKLRSETGYVSQSVMQEDAVDTLELAQLVASSFDRHPNLLQLVPYAWNDLEFELNELARYYDLPAID